ncbi:MAG: Gfo/Idh/MocA family oxidoreductase [Pseudomonadota bacterium]
MTFRAGLIGYGLGGKTFHAPLLEAAGIDLVAIASSRESDIKADFPEATPHANADALLTDNSLDLVIVCTPSQTHSDVTIKALDAGHNVVVDKPFAATAGDADRMIAAAANSGKLLSCFQNRRWDSDFLTIKDLLARDTLGQVHEYQANFEFYKPDPGDVWQNRDLPAVGIEYDLGTHMIDQTVQLFGVPEWVEGDLRKMRPVSQVHDLMTVRFGYGGMRATMTASYLSTNHTLRSTIHGATGSFRKYHMDCQEAQLKGGMKATDPAFGVEDPSKYGTLTQFTDGALQDEALPLKNGEHHTYYRLVREAIQAGTPPPVTAEEARTVIGLIETAQEASKRGTRIHL